MRRPLRNSIINLYYLPALVLFSIFVIYPFIRGIRISFTNWNGYLQTYNYVGFKNYIHFFEDEHVWIAIVNTLIYGFVSTLFQNIIGLGYALFLNRRTAGSTMVRGIVYMQAMVSMIIIAYMYYFIFQYDGGALNDIRALLGMNQIDILSDSQAAVYIITFIDTLQFVGVAMIIYMAGLQNISMNYYEAAKIDGAGPIACFYYITFPMLTPAITSAVILNLIGGLKLFDIILVLTYGGPGFSTHSLSTLIAYTYFKSQNAGYAATIGLFTFFFILLISVVLMHLFSKREVYA